MGHWKDFFRNSLTLGFYNVFIQGINFVTFAVVARFLDKSEYGLVAMISVFSGFLIIFSDAGLSYAVIREDFSEKFLRKLNYLSILIGVSLTILLIALANPIAWFYEVEELFLPTVCLSFVFLIQSVFLIPKAKMQKEMLFSRLGLYMAIGQGITSLVAISMAYAGFSYWSLIFSQLIGLLVQCVLFVSNKPVPLEILNKNELLETVNEVKSLLSNISGFNTINYWARNADNLFIGKIYGEATLGVYNYAYKLLMLPQGIIGSVFSQLFLPSFKKALSENPDFDLQKEITRLLGAVSIVVLPISLVFWLFPDTFVEILFSKSWIEVAEYLPYFGILLIQQSMISFTGNIFVLLKKEKVLFRLGTVNAILLVISMLLGGIISVKALILSYLLTYTLVAVPILLKYGFVDALGFSKRIYVYWIGKSLTFVPLTACIWYNYQDGIIFFSVLTVIMFVATEKESLNLLFKVMFRK